ncbi:hypothetical protein TrVE_jg6879 [Triparma verrucosa]|uniref:Uncharacterized protein n=1 Tax=Triparma verrucosa TaxID=1606542 RepID=A0A9W7BLT9_9STRA|nr:hypothetical protein TrVE_jg6879 [Triparma verrucosa]
MSTPESSLSSASLRWNASRHHEALSTFLKLNVELKMRVVELERNAGGLSEGDVEKMMGDMRRDMEAVVKKLEEELGSSRDDNRRLKSEAEVNGEKVKALTGDNERLKGEVEELRVGKLKLSEICEEIKIDCDALKGEKVILLEKIESLQKMYKSQGDTIISLNEEIVELTRNGGDHAEQIKEIDEKHRRQMEELREGLGREHEEEVNKLKAKIKKLEAANSQLTFEKDSALERASATERRCDKLAEKLEEEKEVREAQEKKFRAIAGGLRKEIEEAKEEKTREEERLNAIIKELREEIARLESRPEPAAPEPEGSKFGMFVDLKSKNKELARELRMEKERQVVGVGGLAGRRRSMRPGMGRGVGIGGTLGGGGGGGGGNGLDDGAGGRSKSAKDRRGSSTAGRKPEEVMF